MTEQNFQALANTKKPETKPIANYLSQFLGEVDENAQKQGAMETMLYNLAALANAKWRMDLSGSYVVPARDIAAPDFARYTISVQVAEGIRRKARYTLEEKVAEGLLDEQVAKDLIDAQSAGGFLDAQEAKDFLDAQVAKGVLDAQVAKDLIDAQVHEGLAERAWPGLFSGQLGKSMITVTPHPNGNLSLDAEAAWMDFMESFLTITPAERQKLLRGGEISSHAEISAKFADFKEKFEAGQKLTIEGYVDPGTNTYVEGELDRGMRFAVAHVDRLPGIIRNMIRAEVNFNEEQRSAYKANGNRLPVTEEQLRSFGQFFELVTWYGSDGDGKPNLTPKEARAAVKLHQEKTRDYYAEMLQKIKDEVTDPQHQEIAKALQDVIDGVRTSKLPLDAEALMNDIMAIRQEAQDRGVRFGDATIDGQNVGISTLDMAFVTVQNFGACFPKMEFRQNALRVRGVMEDVAERLAGAQLITAHEKKDFGKLIASLHGEHGDEIRAFIHGEMAALEAKKAGNEALSQKDVDFLEVLGFFEVAKENPEAVRSFVIAETGAVQEKDMAALSVELQREEMLKTKGADDLHAAFFMLSAMHDKNEKPSTVIMPLLEGRIPIENASAMWNHALKGSKEFSAYIERVGQATMVAQSDTTRMHSHRILPTVQTGMTEVENFARDMGHESLSKRGAGGSLHRGSPFSFLYSDDTTVQGGAAAYFAQIVDYIVERMLSTKMFARQGGVKLDDEQKLRIARLSETGNNMVSVNEIPKEVQTDIKRREVNGCDAYESYMGDPRAQHCFDHSAYGSIVSPNNKGARPNQKKRADVAATFPPTNDMGSARAIGSGLAQVVEGRNAIFVIGMAEFLNLDEDGKLTQKNLKEVKKILKESAVHREMFTRVELGIALSDYQNAWKSHGYEREMVNNEIIISRMEDGKKISVPLKELYDAYKDESKPMSYKGFAADAITLGYEDYTNEVVSRAMYEVRHDLRKDYALRNGKVPGGKPLNFITKDQFIPEHIVELLQPALKEDIKFYRDQLKPARDELAKLNAQYLREGAGWDAAQKQEFVDKTYFPYITVEQVFETSTGSGIAKIMLPEHMHDTWKEEPSAGRSGIASRA